MAIRPNDGETFVREVDEELRRERINTAVSRYGWWIVAAIVLILGATGGVIWWQNHEAEQSAKQGETLLEALDGMESGNRNAAAPKLDQLSRSGVEGYEVAALFARATAQSEANNNAAAIATLRRISGNEDFAEPYRQAALVRQTGLEFDGLRPEQIIQRMGPLARSGSPWFGTAGEMVGIAHLRMNRPDLAGPLFARIGRDETVPPSIRTRAIQMAGSLGINAMPDTPAAQGAAPNASQPDPGEAREKSE
ncbi:MAG TPA: tetratricopeptide repeat protein [Allosphingosinicella sp.]